MLKRLSDQVHRLADKASKSVEVEIEDHGVRMENAFFSRLWTSLVHVLRNAVDHGIESAETREAAGKAGAGLIRVSVEVGDETLVLSVSDDGAGVDGERLVEKALEEGSLTGDEALALSEKQKVQLMFRAGLSARDEADELSGRGVARRGRE